MFDEVFEGEMRDSYANVRTGASPTLAKTQPDEGGSG
jgi:hypothetical protein